MMKAYLCWMVLCSTAFHIWRNRNALRHGNHTWTEEQLIKQIKWKVNIWFITKRKSKKTKGNVVLCSAWGIDI